MPINNCFDIFDFDANPNNFSNISGQHAHRICKSNQKEMQSIVDEIAREQHNHFSFSEIPTAYLVIRLKPEILPDWWRRGDVYRNCNKQQWERAVLEGKDPERMWIIEKEYPVNLPDK